MGGGKRSLSKESAWAEHESPSAKGMSVDGKKFVDDILVISYEDFLGRTDTTSAGHMATLSLGARVIIRSTDNVVQRFPERAGMIGKIVDVPQHPNTWFRIKFRDGKQVTLRPSALTLLETFDEIKSGRWKLAAAQRKKEEQRVQSKRKNGKPSKTLLAHIDPNKWIGKQVVIVGGREIGSLVTVIGCGNGWIQLENEDGDEMSRRASELAIPVGAPIHEPATKKDKEKERKKKIKDAADGASKGKQDKKKAAKRATNGKVPAGPGRLRERSSSASSGSDAFTGGLGDTVMITQGSCLGKKGKVVSAGNGYFCVELSNGSGTQVQKRKWELELLAGRGLLGGNRPRSNSTGSKGSKRSNSSSASTNKYMNERVLVNVAGCEDRITGTVVKSGHGFYTVQLDRASAKKCSNVDGRLMKRKEEIRIIDEDGNIVDGEPFKARNLTAKAAATAARKAHEKLVRERKRKEEERQRKRAAERAAKPRRRSRSRSPSPVRSRSLAPRSKLEATVVMCRERVLAWLNRASEKLMVPGKSMRRPNLKVWLDKINDTYTNEGVQVSATQSGGDGKGNAAEGSEDRMEVIEQKEETDQGAYADQAKPSIIWPLYDSVFTDTDKRDGDDDYTPALWIAPFCRVCRLEKESSDDACWNPACPLCPAYEKGAVPLEASALPRKPSTRTYAIAQSPRKKGYIAVSSPKFRRTTGIDAEYAPQSVVRHSRFAGGRKAEEQNVITNPLVSSRLEQKVHWLGQSTRPPRPPRDGGNNGYFGCGWLSDPDSDSDWDEDDYDMSQGIPTRDSFLEYRWRSWADGNPDGLRENVASSSSTRAFKSTNPHPTVSTAALLMRMTADKVPPNDAAYVKQRMKAIRGSGTMPTGRRSTVSPRNVPKSKKRRATASLLKSSTAKKEAQVTVAVVVGGQEVFGIIAVSIAITIAAST